jgi:hypothetical protein
VSLLIEDITDAPFIEAKIEEKRERYISKFRMKCLPIHLQTLLTISCQSRLNVKLTVQKDLPSLI